jgi:hypothetical protein
MRILPILVVLATITFLPFSANAVECHSPTLNHCTPDEQHQVVYNYATKEMKQLSDLYRRLLACSDDPYISALAERVKKVASNLLTTPELDTKDLASLSDIFFKAEATPPELRCHKIGSSEETRFVFETMVSRVEHKNFW